MKSFSFFEVDEHHSDMIERAFKGATFNRKKVLVERAQSKGLKIFVMVMKLKIQLLQNKSLYYKTL